ncbi:MAG: hypothetical protein QOD10_1746 [Mycobacterium sp.]|nr:hypothetical protein [Mycobacterium sp.]
MNHSDSRNVVLGTKPYHRFISRKLDDMTTQHHYMITKILASAAIAVGVGIWGAAVASAQPNPSNTSPNPYGGLRCSCQGPAPASNPDVKAQIDQGLLEGHTARLPGLPAPVQPR